MLFSFTLLRETIKEREESQPALLIFGHPVSVERRALLWEVLRGSEGYVKTVGLRCVLCLYEANCDPASQERDAFSRLFAVLWANTRGNERLPQ